MIHYKTISEIEKIRQSSLLVSKTLAATVSILKEGISTLFIDNFIATFIQDHKALPAFKGYRGFPYHACISVNDTVVHGLPSESIVLKNGDVLSVDTGVIQDGFYGDSAYTFLIGDNNLAVKNLLLRTKESLYIGIQKSVCGGRLGDISFAIQESTEGKYGYGVVKELVGHGIGRKLHEDPQVPNYGKKGKGTLLKEGIVIAIEPMINLGTRDVFVDRDKWSIKTKDGKVSAHYEHTVSIQKNTADILSDFSKIEAAIKNNSNLWNEL